LDKKKILGISGSTRKNSSSETILKFISDSFIDSVDLEIFDGIDKLPHFNPDLDNENPPVEVVEFRKKIERADGIIFCTPEYVFSLPGSLKNAIDWNVSTTVFSNKAIAIIVAAASGEKAFESLQLILTTIESRIAEESKLLIQGVKGKIGINGEIIDVDTAKKITAVIESLIRSIDEKNGIPTKYISV
jgi:chromate reductase, NAD(P)H dehydrogenase (quinone)